MRRTAYQSARQGQRKTRHCRYRYSQTEELIEVLEKQIQAHRDNALALIRQHDLLARALVLITGIKGIADFLNAFDYVSV